MPTINPIYTEPDLQDRGAMPAADAILLIGAEVIYQENGTAAPGIYLHFSEAYAAALAANPVTPEMTLDPTFAVPIITGGPYDLGGFTLRGPNYFSKFIVNVADGVALSAVRSDQVRVDSMILNFQSKASSPWNPSGGLDLAIGLYNSAGIQADGSATKPFISIVNASSPGSVSIYCSGQYCSLSGEVGAPIISSNAGSPSANVTMGDQGLITSHCFIGAGEIDVTLTDTSVSYDPVQTGATNLKVTVAPGPSADFGAKGTLTTAVDQAIPAGSGTVTSSTDLVLGKIMPKAGLFTKLVAQFTGAAGNVAGQTATIRFQANGVDIPGAVTGALATTAGNKTAAVTIPTPLAYAAGTVITAIVLPSAVLTTGLTDIMGSIS